MTEPIEIGKDNDFSEELRALVIEATQNVPASSAKASSPIERTIREDELKAMLKPILDGIESRNTVSKSMFEALHNELKIYKDAFILETVLRPVIRDMISVFDDLGDTHRHLASAVAAFPERDSAEGNFTLLEPFRNAVITIDHHIHFVIEVLERLDVTQMPQQAGKLDKQLQKAVAVQPTAVEGEDFDIVRTVRRGFRWRDRIVRPEEVVVKKWKAPSPAPQTVPEAID